MTTLFWIYKTRKSVTGLAPLMLRITHDGKRVNITMDIRIPVKTWDSKRQRVKGSSESSSQINSHLTSCQNRVLHIYDALFQKQEQISVSQLAQAYKSREQEHVKLLEAFGKYIKLVEARIGNGYTAGTIKNYRSSFKKIALFIRHIGKEDVLLLEVNRKLLGELDQFIRANLGSANNTAVKNLIQLKAVLKWCRINGWLQHDPFEFFKLKSTEGNRNYLTIEEIKKLSETRLPSESMCTIRDMFLFQVFTGLSHGDLLKLSPEHIKQGVDGRRWIHLFRTKTAALSQIPLLDQAESILHKYRDHPRVLKSGKLLPVYTNQAMNRKLKKIIEIAGIQKKIRSHCGRNTLATSILLGNGVSLETTSKILGHRSTRSTAIYGKITEHKISKELEGLEEKVNQNL